MSHINQLKKKNMQTKIYSFSVLNKIIRRIENQNEEEDKNNKKEIYQ